MLSNIGEGSEFTDPIPYHFENLCSIKREEVEDSTERGTFDNTPRRVASRTQESLSHSADSAIPLPLQQPFSLFTPPSPGHS